MTTMKEWQPNPIEEIDFFAGAHRFLSNFWLAEVKYEGDPYPSVEHAYQAAKTHDTISRKPLIWPSRLKPAEAKHIGKTLDLRPDWNEVRLAIMEDLIRQKFAPGSELASKLVQTGDALLIEGNWWHDNYWGMCEVNCRKCMDVPANQRLNHLGILLMKIREELLSS